ncbi:MAG: prohibitin family protein [Oscillatoriaceae bacterium SKW80]|nr:prohibitin family protein [Oscillatoriaceae bacterium SKYG93]MCX8121775.1 prohibitin family protein [Oscillatoriaceae bacterium SKW80]MDW8453609.1 prohibitin family protein [Oscillatoriaceae cyanobacterium SKYGB_i_bin93]HIK28673.1 prohibitin family protein [Oscillatoriaceae cyanobacterium M7585_C2015_266]
MLFIFSLIVTLSSSLTFAGANYLPENKRKRVKAIALVVALLGALICISRLITIIPAGYVGVVDTFGSVSPTPLKPGIHFLNPFSKLVKFSTRIKDIKETVSTTSREGLLLNLDVSLQYSLNPEKAAEVYKKIGTDEQEIVISRFRSIIRKITSSYESKGVYTEKRQEITDKIREELSQQVTPLGFIVEETLLRDVQLPQNLQAAIQEKLRAEQESQQMEFVLQKERKEAERKQIEAKGIANFQKIVSQGLTPQYLQWKNIEAMEKLATSSNTKVIVIGSGEEKLPILLQGN